MTTAQQQKECNTIVNVRNIGEDLTNEELKEMFTEYGRVTSCQIITSNSVELGRFAYVAFEEPDAAEEAIIELNGQLISENRRIFLRRTHAKLTNHSSLKRKAEKEAAAKLARLEKTFDNKNEIFVKHLVATIDADYLRAIFSHCGEIRSSKVISENGRSKSYGFITFATTEQANRAVAEMNGRPEQGKFLHVSLAKLATTLDSPPSNRSEVYVRHLAPVVNSAYLRVLFDHCGEILSAKVIMHEGVSKGYGFVTFTTTEAADKAVTEMNHRFIEGNLINVALASGTNHSQNGRDGNSTEDPIGQAAASTSSVTRSEIFVKNLAPHITANYLKLLFDNRDRIVSAKIIMENGRSKGFGFVSFQTPEDAGKAVEAMNGRRIEGQSLHVAIARGTDYNKLNTRRNYSSLRSWRTRDYSSDEEDLSFAGHDRDDYEDFSDLFDF